MCGSLSSREDPLDVKAELVEFVQIPVRLLESVFAPYHGRQPLQVRHEDEADALRSEDVLHAFQQTQGIGRTTAVQFVNDEDQRCPLRLGGCRFRHGVAEGFAELLHARHLRRHLCKAIVDYGMDRISLAGLGGLESSAEIVERNQATRQLAEGRIGRDARDRS